jgi:hypothetical protein
MEILLYQSNALQTITELDSCKLAVDTKPTETEHENCLKKNILIIRTTTVDTKPTETTQKLSKEKHINYCNNNCRYQAHRNNTKTI